MPIYILSCKLHHYPTLHSFPNIGSKHQILCHVTFFSTLPLGFLTSFEKWDVHINDIKRGLEKSCTFGLVLLCLCIDDEKYMLSQPTGPERRMRDTWNRAQPRSINPQFTQSYDHQRHSYRFRLY